VSKVEKERERERWSQNVGNECCKENGLSHVRLAYVELALACSFEKAETKLGREGGRG
jgi:hypothetical protein